VRKEFLPFSLPTIGDEEIAEVVDTLKSGWITTGPKAVRFEKRFAEYVGSDQALAVSSCTGGLHLAMTAMGIGPGDEVIVPSMTFCSTVNEIVHLGARPVLIEINDDFNISPVAIESAITPRTKAILPVHHGGQPCDLEEIYRLAVDHNLVVVEDAAHAIGAEYRGVKIGGDRLGKGEDEGVLPRRVTVFSFYANKNMTTGEGGMVTSADKGLMEEMRILSLHGMSRDAWKRHAGTGAWYYEVVSPGYKYNISDILAALGVHQLDRLDGFIGCRNRISNMYDDAFTETAAIKTPIVHTDRKHAFHLYVIRLNLDCLRIDRARFIEELRARNIGSSVHFVPVHMQPFYREKYGYRTGDLPRTSALYDQIVSLPLFPRMSDEDVWDVIAAVNQIVEANRA